jgi:hypothetical protein
MVTVSHIPPVFSISVHSKGVASHQDCTKMWGFLPDRGSWDRPLQVLAAAGGEFTVGGLVLADFGGADFA